MSAEIATYLQLAVSLICVVTLLLQLGRKDQQLTYLSRDVEALKAISSDLVKTQVGSTRDQAHLATQLDGIMKRVWHLEQRAAARKEAQA